MRNPIAISAIIEIIAITIWEGGMAGLAFTAAPAIFQSLASREGECQEKDEFTWLNFIDAALAHDEGQDER